MINLASSRVCTSSPGLPCKQNQVNKLKELIGKLHPSRGFITEEIDWENGEGELVTALAVSSKQYTGGYVLEAAQVPLKTLCGQKMHNGYKIFEVLSGVENDTGLRWEDYHEIAQARGEYDAVTELFVLFARKDIDQELYGIQEREASRLAEEYYAEAGNEISAE